MKIVALLISTFVLFVNAAAAQDARRIVVGFPPGGTLDVLSRAMAPALGEDLGGSVIIENQAGAGSLVAAQAVARAKPDGRTLLAVSYTHLDVYKRQPSNSLRLCNRWKITKIFSAY